MVLIGALLCCIGISGTRAQVANYVPTYYYANYKFVDDWDSMLTWFNKAQAKYSLSVDFYPSEFAELSRYFDRIFPHLTKDYSVVYEKCSMLSRAMSNGFEKEDLEAFMWNSCYKSLMQAVNNINASYTVKPVVVTNPNTWMAPLTVTFDARSSSDPSWETIPADNFYWYYRDENWVDTPIWRGQVITYKFEEPWKFVVHLVIRSSNVDKWILDWESNMIINVTPKAADIVVYANTRKMTKDWPLKIWIAEGEKWVVFDGSLTVPRWWRKILSHRWIIENPTIWFSYDSKVKDWVPGYINVPLKWSWEFKVTLRTNDNEWNTVSQTYTLYMSDPVTIIKQTPSRWTTSTIFNFDWSASYSITNRLNTYYWEVFDANWWDEHWDPIKWWNDKKMSINFSDLRKKPWNYLVRLTVTDMAWNQNVETKDLYVESTPPTPQFVAVPTKIWTYPSEFTLDASNSMDVDVENKIDSLSYSWSFSTNDVDIISTENNNEKVVVRFNSTGSHKVILTVTDEYWASASISKVLDVKSILRPEIEAKPGAITWWKNMQFKSSINDINANIYEYEWDFWDGKSNASEFITDANHVYEQKWVYTVTLKVTSEVTDDKINRNDVKERVFIWEIDSPIAAIKVKDDKWYFIQATETCKEQTSSWVVERVAYPIDRYARFTIDPSYSVNTKGDSKGLQYVFSKQAIMWQDKTQKTNQLTESFSELGCHYVDLQVSDTNVGKEDKMRIWFNVKNALPKLKNLTFSFPQYADNSNMIWFGNTDSNKVSFDCSGTNNLTVKVTAVNAIDPDWMVSRLRFYYYNVDDPERKLEYKDAWMTAPYVYFFVPRVGWEYKFWVFVYDNDGDMIDSDEYLASNPAIYFPASCSDSDVPTVTLKVSSNNIQVWDEVTYTVISKLSMNNEDFATDRTFYYDFTWDGVWDLVTKKDTATYQFLEAYEDWVTPIVAVEYRRKVWKANGDTIFVKNWIKPILIYNSIWNTVIFRDLSVWIIQERTICFEESECDAWNWQYQKIHKATWSIELMTWWTKTSVTENDSFIQKYDNYWWHNVFINLKSKYGIEVQTGFVVKTSNNESNGRIAPWINMITIPEMSFQTKNVWEDWEVKDVRIEVILARNMNNTLLLYLSDTTWWTCYVDTDIATDSDWDWKVDNDMDVLCNKMAKIKYEPEYENTIWRVYFTVDGKLTFKNFYVSFEGYVWELDEEMYDIYKNLTILIDGIDDISVENTDLKNNLNRLRKNLNNKSEVSALVVDINAQIENWWLKMDSNQKAMLDDILFRLANPDTVVAVSVWMNDYEKNKQEILALIPTEKWSTIKDEIVRMFSDFEENVTWYSSEKRIEVLSKIRDTILTDSKKNKWWDDDVYTQYFCNIFSYYDIDSWSGRCGINNELKQLQVNYNKSNNVSESSWEKSWMPLRLKIILIVLVWWVLSMVGIIVFFSIKARLNSASENDEDEW